MDKRCGTCRWFGGLIRKDYMYEDHPEPSERFGFGSCNGIKLNRLPYSWEGIDEPDCLAFTTDVEDYSASLKVRPDFGCVLHEPKPPEADPAED